MYITLQFASYISAFIPTFLTFAYWYKRKFSFDPRVNIIGIYILFYFVIQFIMLILALNSINNLLFLRIFVFIEVFLFSFFLLPLQVKSKKVSLILSVLLCLTIVLIDVIWGKVNSGPIESMMFEAIVITLLGMSAIPSIKIKRDYESSLFYFTFAILFTSINTLLGVGFLDLAPELSFSIQAVVAITTHLIFSWGFYIVLKSKPESTKEKIKEPAPN